MKKIVYISLLLGVAVLLGGCTNSNNNAEDWENSEIVSDNLVQDDIVDDGMENKIGEAASLCFKKCINDEGFIEKIEEFIISENQFINKMETEWPGEEAEQVEYNDIPYLLVGEFSWKEYENQAAIFYSDNYVEEVFTPRYTTVSNMFIELDGKLYRAMADGIGTGIKKDSINAWEVADGLYYVTILEEVGEQLDVCIFIVEEKPDKVHGFHILNKYWLSP